MNNLCVIIPVHKPHLSADEIISLQACNTHLKHYCCYLVFPEGMNVDEYTSHFQTLLLKPVDSSWLSSVENYNRMKLNISFYEMFSDFEFMLTYELDAYIFHADFSRTKAFSYDYIGAPFFEGYLNAKPGASFIKGGNSGFSIRKVHSCIRVLQSMNNYRIHWLLYKHVFSKFPRITFHANRLSKQKYDIYLTGKLGFYFINAYNNEDLVWSQIIPVLFGFFKVADPLSSLQFSFEHNPERLLVLNNGELPLGCHAWPKYANFWNKYINY